MENTIVAITAGKLTIMCVTTPAMKPIFTLIYVITHPPRNGHTDIHRANGSILKLNSEKAVKCRKPNKRALVQTYNLKCF